MRILQSDHASRVANGQAVIKAIVAASAPLSRAEMARDLGLSKQTLSEITSLLEQAGWIQEVGRKQGALGRAAVSYQLNADVNYAIGVIFEGQRYTAGLADMRGNLRATKSGVLPTNAINDGAAFCEHLSSLVHGLVADAKVALARVGTLVMGFPGIVDQVNMRVKDANNLPALVGLDLPHAMAERFGFAVQIDNDLNLHAYGEYRFGCSQRTGSSVFIGVGSGIGMGIMLGDTLWRGAQGGAGEIARLPLNREPQAPQAQRLGALEYALSQTLENAQGLNEVARFDAIARDCAFAIACIAPVLEPEIVVLGGPYGDHPQLHARLPDWLHKFSKVNIAVRRSALGTNAGLLGAVATGIQVIQDKLFRRA